MKKWLIALIAFSTLPLVHTQAATSVSNESGTSSMYGLNGQFEQYNPPNIVKPKTVSKSSAKKACWKTTKKSTAKFGKK